MPRFRNKGWVRAAKHVLRMHPFRPLHHRMRMNLPPQPLGDQCGPARAHGCPRCSLSQRRLTASSRAHAGGGALITARKPWTGAEQAGESTGAQAGERASRPRPPARGARASLTSSDIVWRGGESGERPKKKPELDHADEEGVHSPPAVFQALEPAPASPSPRLWEEN
jgi:hypothetical protein